jgi:hypothetical protein
MQPKNTTMKTQEPKSLKELKALRKPVYNVNVVKKEKLTTLGPKEARFDPYPAFVLWLFISNMIQIFLMPLIMIGQNLQSDHAEIRAEADFEVNTKAELEIETILMHLENQNKIIMEILQKLENKSVTQ